MATPEPVRCDWVSEGADPLMRAYHDEEWGSPSHDDEHLFEMLVLEGAQAGLSWRTILNKREGYRRAFARFDPVEVARFDDADIGRLLLDPGIVRNRLKVSSAVTNAKAVLATRDEFGSLDAYLWRFVDGRPTLNRWARSRDVPVETEASLAMSKDLRRRGFRFVGPTVCYAFMEATGMVNDHLISCFRHEQVGR